MKKIDYFKITQITKKNGIVFPNISQKQYWENKYDILCCFTTESCENLQFLPFYSHPAWLLSEDMFAIAYEYQIGQTFKSCLFGEKSTKFQRIFYAFRPFQLECLHETTEKLPDGRLKNLVLDRQLIGPNKIFQPMNLLESYLIIDLEILEKLLSSGIYPIDWEPVACV